MAADVVTGLGAIDTTGSHRVSWWTSRRIVAVGGTLVLLVAAALGIRRLVGPPRDTGSPNVLAVLPFTVRGSTELAYLGEGLVELLSASLDGAAGIRSVNARALLGFVGQGAPAISLERARTVAEHFQAGLFVVGDVLEVDGKVRLSASLFDRTGARPVAEATADGQADELFALVDLLATRLAADKYAEGGAVSLGQPP